jgi:hypothetical protein
MDSIVEEKQAAKNRGGTLTVVASVCRTDSGPQILELQLKLLKEAGVPVFQSNALWHRLQVKDLKDLSRAWAQKLKAKDCRSCASV